MSRGWARVAFAVAAAMAGLVVPSSAVLRTGPPPIDKVTELQLATAARTLLQQRSSALVQRAPGQPLPTEVAGVRISAQVAKAQRDALRGLETRNRAPVDGGPPYTSARTRIQPVKTIRTGDKIVLEATEYTEVEYEGDGADRKVVRQAVKRRFEFTDKDDRLTMIAETPADPKEPLPLNDPEPAPAESPATPGQIP